MDFAAARQSINLGVLRRHDPFIVGILDTSSHVTVYTFDLQTQSWSKRGIEGVMFVFQRSAQPIYGFFVMNRLGTDNLIVSLTGDLQFQTLGDYLIYKLPDADNGQIRLQDIWARIESMGPVADGAPLSNGEFHQRLYRLIRDPDFTEQLFNSYAASRNG
nr:hypothetical protein HK105_001753 [Polyrhizophydium stewartii]